jgi:hypothetical protein
MSHKDNFSVLVDNLHQPKRTVDQVAADIAAALKAGPSPRLCKELAEMIDPKGRPVVRWRLKLQRPKQGRPEVDVRIGMEMATLVDDEGLSVKAAVFRIQNKYGVKGNRRSKCLDALNHEREMRELAELVDKAGKPSPE